MAAGLFFVFGGLRFGGISRRRFGAYCIVEPRRSPGCEASAFCHLK